MCCCRILIVIFERLYFSGDVEQQYWESCKISVHCDVELGYHHGVCCGTEVKHGEPSPIWPAAFSTISAALQSLSLTLFATRAGALIFGWVTGCVISKRRGYSRHSSSGRLLSASWRIIIFSFQGIFLNLFVAFRTVWHLQINLITSSTTTAETGYNNIDLCDTSPITSDILWYQFIPYC
jgi:hypothetical protein